MNKALVDRARRRRGGALAGLGSLVLLSAACGGTRAQQAGAGVKDEAAWLSCADPTAMPHTAGPRLTARKLLPLHGPDDSGGDSQLTAPGAANRVFVSSTEDEIDTRAVSAADTRGEVAGSQGT